MKKIISVLLAAVLAVSLAACQTQPSVTTPADTQPPETTPAPPVVDPVNDNFRTFYQVFVGSFSDSNNDGIGDLRGLINRLDYLNDGDINSGESLGVQGIWLSPIFSSPSYHKYDTTDYYSVDWRFGVESDLKELIEKCHERNVKVILDLAINHTSSQHPWFLEFKQARAAGDTENPYYDYYSCVPTSGKKGGISYGKVPGADCWYECNFSGDMPELNFDNITVRQEMVKVAQYYLDMGIDGFRFDAIKYIYYGDTDRNIAFWTWYMSELLQYKPDIYCVGECWSGESEIVAYNRAMNCFNFAMAQAEGVVASAAKGFGISRYTGYIASYQKRILEENPNAMVMGFLSNHDMDRIAGAFVTDNNMRMAANLYLLCAGSPVIYYGEEIGIRGSRGGENTDANRRLAMLWGDDDLVRDPAGSTYPAKNQIQTTVADQLADENSMLRYYQRLIALRHKYPAIARGIYTSLDCGERNFGGFSIAYGDQTLGVLHNNGQEPVQIDLSTMPGGFTQLCDFIGVGDASLEGTVLTVAGQTSVIVK